MVADDQPQVLAGEPGAGPLGVLFELDPRVPADAGRDALKYSRTHSDALITPVLNC
jgi:hypothetical protein